MTYWKQKQLREQKRSDTMFFIAFSIFMLTGTLVVLLNI